MFQEDDESEASVKTENHEDSTENKTFSNGEESYIRVYSARAKILRYRENEWKERGTGEMRLLKHKLHKFHQFVMRQEKTLHLIANFCIGSHIKPKTFLEREKLVFLDGPTFDFSSSEKILE